MIQTVEINDLRGIRTGAIRELTPLSVLVGRNGCGKSTVLDALALAGATDLLEAGTAALNRRGGDDPQLVPDWLVRRGCASASVEISNAERHVEKLRLQTVQGGGLDLQGTTVPGYSRAHLGPSRGGSGTSGNRNPPQPAAIRFIDLRAIAKLRVAPDELYSEARTSGRKGPVLELVRSLIPNVEDIEILKIDGKPSLCLSYKDTAIPLSLSGDGVRNSVVLAFELGVAPGTLILIEEPETHLHPAAMRKAAEAMVRTVLATATAPEAERNQLILATHSLEFIDALVSAATELNAISLLSVHRLATTNGELKVSSFSGDLVASARGEVEQDLR